MKYAPNNILIGTCIFDVFIRGDVVIFRFLDNGVVLRGSMVTLDGKLAGDDLKGTEEYGTKDRDRDKNTKLDRVEVGKSSIFVRDHVG